MSGPRHGCTCRALLLPAGPRSGMPLQAAQRSMARQKADSAAQRRERTRGLALLGVVHAAAPVHHHIRFTRVDQRGAAHRAARVDLRPWGQGLACGWVLVCTAASQGSVQPGAVAGAAAGAAGCVQALRQWQQLRQASRAAAAAIKQAPPGSGPARSGPARRQTTPELAAPKRCSGGLETHTQPPPGSAPSCRQTTQSSQPKEAGSDSLPITPTIHPKHPPGSIPSFHQTLGSRPRPRAPG